MGINNGLRKWKLFNKTLTVVNGLLLCSTGYSTQYCVETYMGKKKKKIQGEKNGCKHRYNWFILLCTWNSTL